MIDFKENKKFVAHEVVFNENNKAIAMFSIDNNGNVTINAREYEVNKDKLKAIIEELEKSVPKN